MTPLAGPLGERIGVEGGQHLHDALMVRSVSR